jgi:spore maturation protein CgeB
VLNCSARIVLNVNRSSMADVGFSPPTRIFEAAGAGACLITDSWDGISQFFEPGQEILVASSAEDVVSHLTATDERHARRIGEAMRQRALRDHTYQQRALQVQAVFSEEQQLSEQAA